jgi:hypothetical protein
MLVPIYTFLKGDTLGLVVLTQDHVSIAQLAKNALEAAAMRIRPMPNPVVRFNGVVLDPQLTVAQAGIAALDRIDVGPE